MKALYDRVFDFVSGLFGCSREACIWSLSPSRIDHHGWRSVAVRVSVPGCGGGGDGFAMYITQYAERGATSPTITFSLCDSGRET